MNIQIVKNKYLNALFILMFFSAVIHMAIISFWLLLTRDVYIFNYFNILDLDLFFPNMLNSVWGNLFSLVFMVSFYLIIFKCQERKS